MSSDLMGGRDRNPASLGERVDALVRYAELAAAQLAALEEDDLERVAALAAERDAIATEIDAGPEIGELVAGSLTDPSDQIARARLTLSEGIEAMRAFEDRLVELRAETLAAIESLEGRGAALRQYMESDASGREALDIRL